MIADGFYDFRRYDLIEDQCDRSFYPDLREQSVLVLCKSDDLSGPNKELLTKILAAIGQNFDNTQIVGVRPDQKINVTEILNIVKPSTLLSFHINLNTHGLKLEQKLYRIIGLMDTSIIISEALTILQDKIESKKRLWNELQTQFNINKK